MIDGLFNTPPEKIKRDLGEEIRVWSSPLTRVYMNSEMERLSSEYDISLHTGLVPSSLGDAGCESAVADLFNAYKLFKKPCGFSERDLLKFGEQSGHTHDLMYLLPDKEKDSEKDLFKLERIAGEKVIFPTEELLINQRVPRRSEGFYLERKKINPSRSAVAGMRIGLRSVTKQ